MELARTHAKLFSSDKHTKVGTILLHGSTRDIIACGSNQLPRGISDDGGSRLRRPLKYKCITHSEMAAICSAASQGTSTLGCIAVITLFPCATCATALIQCGCVEIVCPVIQNSDMWDDDWKLSHSLLKEAGVRVTFV